MRKKHLKSSYQPGEVIETNLVGVTYEGRQRIVARLMVGDEVNLKREPDNPHDPNAIMASVYKYTKAEREKFKLDRVNRDVELRRLLAQYKKLGYSLMFNRKEFGEKYEEYKELFDQIGERIDTLREEEKEIANKNETFKELHRVQVGYINRDLAKLIAPIFDKNLPYGPAIVVGGEVVQLTGREKADHTKGIRIRFKLPDQDDFDDALNADMMGALMMGP